MMFIEFQIPDKDHNLDLLPKSHASVLLCRL